MSDALILRIFAARSAAVDAARFEDLLLFRLQRVEHEQKERGDDQADQQQKRKRESRLQPEGRPEGSHGRGATLNAAIPTGGSNGANGPTLPPFEKSGPMLSVYPIRRSWIWSPAKGGLERISRRVPEMTVLE